MRLLLFAGLVALAPSLPRPAGACGAYPADRGPHALDAAFANDTTPPTTPAVIAEAWEGGSSSGCGDSKCGHPSLVHVTVAATDDRAPPNRIGYKLAITRGEPPQGFTPPSGALLAEMFVDGTGELGLRYDDDAPSGWSFDLQVTAVDLNGNKSAPVTVTIEG
jgi:hypothetical protein